MLGLRAEKMCGVAREGLWRRKGLGRSLFRLRFCCRLLRDLGGGRKGDNGSGLMRSGKANRWSQYRESLSVSDSLSGGIEIDLGGMYYAFHVYQP